MVTAALAGIAERLRSAKRVLFITGAGMSADSGLPTYRGVGGLYDGIETDDGIAIEDALSGATMRQRPDLCWKYIMQVEAACRGAEPNQGHRAIASLERHIEQIWVLTQNVDGLHRAAGSSHIIDIHGDVRELLCTACDHRQTVPDYRGLSCPPHCPSCDAVVRPDVVLFGEMLPLHKVARLRAELMSGFDVVFSIGTSSLFPYITEPLLMARASGSLTVEINPTATDVSALVDEKLSLGASQALGSLLELVARGR